ncbi:Uncharacterised protein [Mycobacteroides abscessus subsp. abscessus]|nr:Uncharacterised protein [Mycobacteroides abscessus subsp. abscessus]
MQQFVVCEQLGPGGQQLGRQLGGMHRTDDSVFVQFERIVFGVGQGVVLGDPEALQQWRIGLCGLVGTPDQPTYQHSDQGMGHEVGAEVRCVEPALVSHGAL